jgi:hypothetical protein
MGANDEDVFPGGVDHFSNDLGLEFLFDRKTDENPSGLDWTVPSWHPRLRLSVNVKDADERAGRPVGTDKGATCVWIMDRVPIF